VYILQVWQNILLPHISKKTIVPFHPVIFSEIGGEGRGFQK
jgi:hypothetical protein